MAFSSINCLFVFILHFPMGSYCWSPIYKRGYSLQNFFSFDSCHAWVFTLSMDVKKKLFYIFFQSTYGFIFYI